LVQLSRCEDVEKETRHELQFLARQFQDVAEIRLSGTSFRSLVISRNNREYIFLMRLCQFVYWSLMPDDRGAETRFQKILEDDVRMSAVFEDFLRKFFELHRKEYRVRAESGEWHVSDATEDDLALLPRMVTDITLRHPDHTIIVDAKFYRQALSQSPYGEKVRSQHLYQLVTYLQNERMQHHTAGIAGMLIYPAVGRTLRLRYRLLEIPVLVATVDLGKEWPEIEAELHDLMDDCAEVARLTGVVGIH
jgi:5-methylcytosine-specific restriction enzyme subunit McrC